MNLKALKDQPSDATLISKKRSETIRRMLKKMSVMEMKTYYNVSEKVARNAYEMLHTHQTGCAIELFEGLVFKNLDYATLGSNEKAYVNDHVYIASALYGVVTPLHHIMPYRLDLDSSLKVEDQTLLQYWRKSVTGALMKHPTDVIVDLASEEYSQMVDWDTIKKHKTVMKIDFKEERNGKLTSVSTYSKMARGQFIRQAALSNAQSVEDIEAINVMGYAFTKRQGDGDSVSQFIKF